MKRQSTIKIAYIGGGSKGWAKKLLSDLLLQEQITGSLFLYDIDMEASYINQQYFNKLIDANSDAIKSKWEINVSKKPEDCLIDCDFVVMSITPGTLEHMGNDVHYPEKYGIFQSVGDTVGVGGYSRALRTLPIYIYYAKLIEQYCPEAWVINYTNPMTIATMTLYEVFPAVKAFGCCHEVFKSQKLLLESYSEQFPSNKSIPISDVKINLIGINHFTWINKATYMGEDLMKLYETFVSKYKDSGYDLDKENEGFTGAEGSFKLKLKSLERVKMDLFHKYKVMAAAGDRHLAEFMPNVYLKDEATVDKWNFKLTHIDDRYSNLNEKINIQIRVINNEMNPLLEPSNEEGVHQMLAILGYEDLITNVNLPNIGQIENLPLGAIVETNAQFAKNNVTAVPSGNVPEDIKPLIQVHLDNQVNFVKAYLNQDTTGIFQVFMNEPSVSKLQPEAIRSLFRELVILNKEFNEDWVVEAVLKNTF